MSRESDDVIIWGEPSWDTVASVGSEAKTDTRSPALVADAVGGSGANTALSLAKVGIKVVLYGTIGKDNSGTSAKKILKDHGVETRLRSVERNRRTVSIATPDGHRTMYGSAGDQYFGGPQDTEPRLGTAHILHASLTSIVRAQYDLLSDLARLAANCSYVTLDAGNAPELAGGNHATVARALNVLKPTVLFANEDEYETLVLHHSVSLQETKFVVVKHGPDPCLVYECGVLTQQLAPEARLTAVNSTGAGDAFAAGFIAAAVRTSTIDECLEMGHQLAGMCVQEVGATLTDSSRLRRVQGHLKARSPGTQPWLRKGTVIS
jgi:sugar/nucleoside kinase (ribokinase family)